MTYRPNDFSRRLAELLGRISLGIPPAEIRGETVGFRDALLAGWLYKLAKLPIPVDTRKTWEPDDDETLQRLVLKAMEYTDLSTEYTEWSRTSHDARQ
jgi:hypothetical protein